LAAESLTAYANAIEIPGRPAVADPDGWLFDPIETTLAAHHLLQLRHLEAVAIGEIRRLMVFMPPGSAKSTYTSVVFPTWFMGRNPGSRIILASYASDIARKQGRRARQIVRSDLYRPIFDATISDDTSAADNWALTNESEYMAGGILSGITGNRAHGIIADDLIAGREQADSETIRKKTREAYEDDLRTRLVPGGWEVLMQTRWHPKDLPGSYLPADWKGESGPIRCRDGNVWHVLCLPAEAERKDDPLGRQIGERLWPEWFTADHFATFKRQPRTWGALFQQRPTDPEGGYFRRDWFRHIIEPDRLPRLIGDVRAWDLAATTEDESDDPDYLAGVRMGKGIDGRYYLRHVHKARTTPRGVETTVRQFAHSDGRSTSIRIEQEGAASGKIVKDYYERMMDGWDCRFTGIPRGSKFDRSKPFNAACERGDVVLVAGDWIEDFIAQATAFPTGAHDDMVDAAVGAYEALQTPNIEVDDNRGWLVSA
jgi:predicted phage terminase large subunit-like protein